MLEEVGESAFNQCTSLKKFSAPVLTEIDIFAFGGCSQLHEIDIPECLQIGTAAFYGCSSLETAVLEKVTYISGQAFQNCSALSTLVLKYADGVVQTPYLSPALDGTAIAAKSGYIYVPDELVDDYKLNTAWNKYSSQIKPLSEYTGD